MISSNSWFETESNAKAQLTLVQNTQAESTVLSFEAPVSSGERRKFTLFKTNARKFEVRDADNYLEETYFFSENINSILAEVVQPNVEDALNSLAATITDMVYGSQDDEPDDDCDSEEGQYNYDDDDDSIFRAPAAPSPNSSAVNTEVTAHFSTGRAGNANKRLMQDIIKIMSNDTTNLGFGIEQINPDRFDQWQVKLFGFDKDSQLQKDLECLQKQGHSNSVELEMSFEDATYPFSPPFIRVVRPRFAFHTGHVTIGGSICMELLTKSGWRPTNDIESVLIQIRAEMIAGDARLDLANNRPYSLQEAKSAFTRVAAQHGWQ